jgi:hypothetical protein
VCGFTSLWKLILVVAMLAGFAAIGIGCVINPNWAIKHFGQSLRKDGELEVRVVLHGFASVAGSRWGPARPDVDRVNTDSQPRERPKSQATTKTDSRCHL